MAETTTIARPYAEALFQVADRAGNLKSWSDLLETMANVAAHPDMVSCIENPKLKSDQIADLFVSLCKGITAEGKNLVKLLMENRRLALLPEMRALFEDLKNAREGVLKAQIFSAFPMDDAQKKVLLADLERKFKQRVEATVTVDPELIGGVKVVAGDQVIDASVRAKLAAMEVALKV